MLRLALAGTLTALLVAGARPARAEADKGAKAIIARAVEAQGGAAALEKYKASTVKLKGMVHTPFGEGAMTATIRAQQPDKLNLDMKLKFGGADIDFKQVVDGDKGWFIANGDAQDLNKDMMAETREQMYVGRVTDLRGLDAKGVKLSALGEAKVGDRAAAGVRVSSAGHHDISLYFDKDNHLLLKSEAKGKDPTSGEEYTEVKVYGGYKKVSGIMVPHKVTATRDGKPHAETEVTEVTFAEKLPDATFAKP